MGAIIETVIFDTNADISSRELVSISIGSILSKVGPTPTFGWPERSLTGELPRGSPARFRVFEP